MATIYWFALVVGGGLLAASLFGDLFDSEVGDVDADAGDAHAAKFLSLRNLTYFLFGFGAIGVLLNWFGLLPPPAAAGAATLIGVVTAAAAAMILEYVQRTASGEHESEESFVGCTGRVTLPFGEERAGRVVIQRGHREYELRARPLDSHAAVPGTGTGVIVIEMDGGTALVAALEESLPASGLDA